MTTQIAVKLPDSTVLAVDRLVRDGTFASRSAAVRAGLDLVLQHGREEAIDRAFADGFARLPDTDEELAVAEGLARRSIEEEPWEPWW
jgi:Arc/MetJ-type ribon-helix-helix transcriptional regulator